jgi:hypothetical protein
MAPPWRLQWFTCNFHQIHFNLRNISIRHAPTIFVLEPSNLVDHNPRSTLKRVLHQERWCLCFKISVYVHKNYLLWLFSIRSSQEMDTIASMSSCITTAAGNRMRQVLCPFLRQGLAELQLLGPRGRWCEGGHSRSAFDIYEPLKGLLIFGVCLWTVLASEQKCLFKCLQHAR